MAEPWPYPAPLDDGAADHLRVGLKLPEIPLYATSGDRIALANLPGRSIVFAYPWTGQPGMPNPPGWDDIPGAHGSTPEAEGFAALYPRLREMEISVYGLSTQDTDWQAEFAERIGLPFPLLSDAEFAFARALKLPTFKAGDTSYLVRLTLIIADGCIEHVDYPVHPPHTHAHEVFKRVAASGQAHA